MNNRGMADRHQEDEVSLVDAWRTLVRHKKMVFFIWVLISLSGVIAAVVVPEKYVYTTLIEVGSQGKDLVETAAAARARLIASIIYVAQRKYLDEGKGAYDINIEVLVKGPSFLLLESRGSVQSAQDHLALHRAVLEALRQEHQATFIFNKGYEASGVRQEVAKRRVAELQDERVLLGVKLKRLDEEEASLMKQAIKSDANAALVHMILINQIEVNRAEIKKDTADNMRAMDEQRSALSIIARELGGLRETKAAVPFAQSKIPVAPNRRLIIMLAIFGGLMMGALSAFLMESFLKVRKGAEHS